MTIFIKNTHLLLILILVFFGAGCGTAPDSEKFRQELTDINTQMKETLEQMEHLKDEKDVSVFKDKASALLGAINNDIEQYHLLMDETNQKIDKEARDRIINFKEKKVEIDYKLSLLSNEANYLPQRDTLSYADTVLTSRTATGSAVTHEIEPLEVDETEVPMSHDTSLALAKSNEWEYAGVNLRDELMNDLQEIHELMEVFRERNL